MRICNPAVTQLHFNNPHDRLTVVIVSRVCLDMETGVPLSTCDSVSEGPLQGIRVLIVEDHVPVAQALEAVLTDTGMEIVGSVATSADAELLTKSKNPDLVLVDLNLGGEEAVSLIQWMLTRRLRVIVMSGFAMPPSPLSEGIAYLQKPFSGDELLETMQSRLLSAA